MLLLCTCPGGTGGHRHVPEQLPAAVLHGSQGWLGAGDCPGSGRVRLAHQRLGGCLSLELLSTARARELWLEQVPACFSCSGAGSAAAS